MDKAAEGAVQPVRRVLHDPKTNFTIVSISYEHYVEFVIYDIIGFEDGDEGKPVWQKSGAKMSPDPVYSSKCEDAEHAIEMAEVFLRGSVKWDGCSNWHFDEQDRVMLHGCSREGIQRFGDVMGLCWDLAAEFCPSWCH